MNFTGKVLLVDDEAHIRKFVALILKQLGVTAIVEASNGAEAVEIYQREKPDLVLLDVNMPVLDGMQTLRQLNALDPDCIVIMLTSLANRQTVEEAMEHGAASYIRKDTPKEEILKSLSETIAACFRPE
jgi:two-component system chemotaxis response regulator CheY